MNRRIVNVIKLNMTICQILTMQYIVLINGVRVNVQLMSALFSRTHAYRAVILITHDYRALLKITHDYRALLKITAR